MIRLPGTAAHAVFRSGSDVLLDHAMSTILYDTQEALHGVYANFPVRPLGWLMRGVTFPTGRVYKPPSDKQTTQVSSQPLPGIPSESGVVGRQPD